MPHRGTGTPRLGRETRFTIEATDDPPFDRRIVLSLPPRGGWIVLSYRMAARPRPLRPMLRLCRADAPDQEVVLPGVALGAAHWLGYLPRGLREIRLAAEPGFVLERVGLRSHADVLAECLAKRPLRAAAALYARLRGDERRFRDILRGACAVTGLDRYGAWRGPRLRDHDPRDEMHGPGLAVRLIIPAGAEDGPLLAATLAALRAQTHRDWTALVCGEGVLPPVSAHADERIAYRPWNPDTPLHELLADADALALLRPGDRPETDALAILAGALTSEPACDLAYADEEVGDVPRLNPDWSPDLVLARGEIGGPALLSRDLIYRLGEIPAGSPTHLASRLALAVSGEARRVVHVPRILSRSVPPPVEATAERARRLDAQCRAVGLRACARVVGEVLDLHRPRPEPAPLVSIIIPSRDRLDLIERVTRGVLRETEYPAIELIVVDNGSTDPAVLAFYERLRREPRVRIEGYPHPFNFSAMVNAGAAVAAGEVLVFLNNDIAVLRPEWLDALVAQAVRPEIGAVGAKLLYEDGRLQHAGVVVGLGGRAGHILRRRPADSPGHLGRMHVAHEVSAVTAACLAVTREKYETVGGFDAKTFPIDFNDVDFCLRLNAAGWKTIWTPHAVLSHLESVSRGPAVGEARQRFEREADAFVTRWRDVVRHDPFYHPALSLTTFGEDLE